jgi:hypothetical protein
MLERATMFPDGVIHGFSTRLGGVSAGRYESLNLGERWGDDPAAVTENKRILAGLGGYEVEQLVQVRQVHGDRAVAAADVQPGVEADAIWHHVDQGRMRQGGPVVSVMTADCVPVLLVDRRRRVCAAIHSGWKGTVANIVGKTAALLVDQGIAVGELLAAIGPCIEIDAFEVGEEVAVQFEPRFVRRRPPAKPHVDLVAVVRGQLEAVGIPSGQIERVGTCTHANPDRYFSYRRDGAGIGQMLSFIGLGD